MRANERIRQEAGKNGIFLWQIAYELGISESYFCRLLRQELPEIEREKCMRAIDAVVERRKRAIREGSDFARSRAYQDKLRSAQG